MEKIIKTIRNTFSYGVIYVYSIPDGQHQDRLKIGSATVNSVDPTNKEILKAARLRIDQQTKTADIKFKLEHAELAITNDNTFFSDRTVHNILRRSGFERKSENVKNTHSEWFEISLNIAISAIQAAKEGRRALETAEKIFEIPEFEFRPNQLDAIDKTSQMIRRGKKNYLWNAKMRFGKTSTAMELARQNGFEKILIATHRPSVHADWYKDFEKVFAGSNYQFSSNTRGEHIKTHLNNLIPFVYFASIQDLRLSKRVVQDEAAKSQAKGFEKNEEVFDTDWDMLIIDEAHEGTQRDLGKTTIEKIKTNFTLELSGTPFNIMHKRESDSIYTWDYVMEQRDKQNWDSEHPGEPNPYAELPSLQMFTYDVDTFSASLGDIGQFQDLADGAFKFHEFFRVHKDDDGKDIAEFVHESMVNKFLDLMVDDEQGTQFPYSTDEYRSYLKHSLWLLPNRTKIIEAMEKLLKAHPVFGKFGIVNISGNRPSDDDETDNDAKSKVENAIKSNEYTITLTGQRLTTGASIPEWAAVFMLSDTSSATTYLQTAFRCQTPAVVDGKLKTQGYVFDFAPDRTLKLVAEAVELNHKSGRTNTPEQRQAMEDFLNFCPIIATSAGRMQTYDVENMLEQLKKAIIERVSRNGFDDPKLYNNELLELDELDITKFNNLQAIVGKSNIERTNQIDINNLGLNKSLTKQAEEAERKKKNKKQLSPEDEAALKKLKEAREQKKNAISILRAVSIRMPMLVYGAKVEPDQGISLDDFINIVDDESWVEFMPKDLTKSMFSDFVRYYDEEVFRGVTKNIRLKAYECDKLLPVERIQAIADIFSTFKNPDKETVLTPWNVVNMHMTLTLGGHDFRDGVINKTGQPEWKSAGEPTKIWAQQDVKILEINSKSGMYPLLAAYNVYTRKLKNQKQPEDRVYHKLWREVLSENIYVLCKSPMAKTITIRTLAGYSHIKTNVAYLDGLVEELRDQKGYNLNKELQREFGENVKFTAVVGNPPYQVNTDTNFATPVYHLFIEAAKSLKPNYVSLIHPARFLFNAGATPKEWNQIMLNDVHLSVPLYEAESQKIFSGVDIKGGVAITIWNKNDSSGGLGGIFVANEELRSVINKVSGGFDQMVGPRGGTKIKRWTDSFGRPRTYFPSNAFFLNDELFSKSRDGEHTVKIVGLERGNKRSYRYTSADLIEDKNIDKWKVFMTQANGSGAFGEALSTLIIGAPNEGCTETFVRVGSFNHEAEAVNCAKYLKTKLCRAMLSTLKITQANTKEKWRNVPLQDFKPESNIDWSQSISEIDQQLYKKYGLDKSEIDYIETNVKAME